MWASEEYILLGEVFYKYRLNPVDWWCWRAQLCPSGSYACCTCRLPMWSLSSPSVTVSVHFSLRHHPFLLHVLGCPVVRCMHVNDCYVFLEGRPFNPQHPPYFTLDIFPCSGLSLSEINMATLDLFSLALARYIFLNLFILNSSVSLYLKWFSCRHDIVGSFLKSTLSVSVF